MFLSLTHILICNCGWISYSNYNKVFTHIKYTYCIYSTSIATLQFKTDLKFFLSPGRAKGPENQRYSLVLEEARRFETQTQILLLSFQTSHHWRTLTASDKLFLSVKKLQYLTKQNEFISTMRDYFMALLSGLVITSTWLLLEFQGQRGERDKATLPHHYPPSIGYRFNGCPLDSLYGCPFSPPYQLTNMGRYDMCCMIIATVNVGSVPCKPPKYVQRTSNVKIHHSACSTS